GAVRDAVAIEVQVAHHVGAVGAQVQRSEDARAVRAGQRIGVETRPWLGCQGIVRGDLVRRGLRFLASGQADEERTQGVNQLHAKGEGWTKEQRKALHLCARWTARSCLPPATSSVWTFMP